MTMIMRYPTAPLAAKMKSVAEVSTIERKVTCIAHDNGSNVKNFGRHSLGVEDVGCAPQIMKVILICIKLIYEKKELLLDYTFKNISY